MFPVAVRLPNRWEDVMEHKTLDKLRDVAEIVPNWLEARSLSRSERLKCWAEALEREGGRRLSTLFEVEYQSPAKRAAVRADDSLLSVAFNDPRLRAEGLAGDIWVTLSRFSASARASCTISSASVIMARRSRPIPRPRRFAPLRRASASTRAQCSLAPSLRCRLRSVC